MILLVNYLGKMRGYPQFSFWISITLLKIYIPCIIINRGKNTIELVGTVLKSVFQLEYKNAKETLLPFKMSRQFCSGDNQTCPSRRCMYMLCLLYKAILIIFIVFVLILFPWGGRDVKQCFVMWLVQGKKDELREN